MSIRCFKCGSKNVQTVVEKDQSYSIGKGLVGTMMFGTGGAVMGVNGKVSEKVNYSCRECGHVDTIYMNPSFSEFIDLSIKNNDEQTLRRVKKTYPNIEWTEKEKTTYTEYKQEKSEKEEIVRNYCEKHLNQPIYISEMSNTIGLSKSDCNCAIRILMEKGLITVYLFADVKENDDIPYKYCIDEHEIIKNIINYKERQRRDAQYLKSMRNSRDQEEVQLIKEIKELRKQEKMALENDFEYVEARKKRISELEPLREKTNKAGCLISTPRWEKPFHLALLTADGTIKGFNVEDAQNWQDIIKIEDDIGIDNNGHIWGPELVDIEKSKRINSFFNSFKDIKQIITTAEPICYIGLRNDGTIVTFGDCENYNYVKSWTNIKKIYAYGKDTVFGIKFDGTLAFNSNKYAGTQLEDWKDIVQITANEYSNSIVGLCADGTLEIFDLHPLYKTKYKGELLFEDLKKENDIVAICEKISNPLILLHKDGSVSIHKHNNEEKENKYSCFKNVLAIKHLKKQLSSHIVVCIHEDGSIEVIKDLHDSENNTFYLNKTIEISNKIKLFENIDKLKEERERIKEQKRQAAEKERQEKERRALIAWRKKSNLCQYCGGEFKGLFTKKCRECGK